MLVVLAVVLTAAVGIGIAVRADSPTPFPLASMQVRATLTVTDATHAQRVADRLAGRGRLSAFTGDSIGQRQQLVGQLQFDAVGRSGDDGQLAFFVIDNRLNRPLNMVEGVGGRGANVSRGWDGRYQRLADKYSWLRSLAAIPDGAGGYRDPGEAVAFSPTTGGPVTFVAVMDDSALPIEDLARDLTFVIAYLGGNRGAWAERIPVSGATAA
jgi:hypothetical protein